MRKLVFGCGYVGQRVATLWRDQGHEVTVVTRSAQRASEWEAQGLRTRVADVTQPQTLPALDWDTVLYAVGYDRQAGPSMHAVYVDGLAAVLDRFVIPPTRFLYISSTGVYGDAAGDIDENTPCSPVREGGRACLAAERLLAAHAAGTGRIILRLAGIYGPGRLPRRADLLAQRPLQAERRGQLNLIHVDDAAAAVLAAETYAQPPALYIVSDGHPVERETYYQYAAELIGAPPPQFAETLDAAARAGRTTGPRRLANDRLLRELGVVLRYPSYREGLAAALGSS